MMMSNAIAINIATGTSTRAESHGPAVFVRNSPYTNTLPPAAIPIFWIMQRLSFSRFCDSFAPH
jgi:hypothetical protein